jgi:hypothetical protein
LDSLGHPQPASLVPLPDLSGDGARNVLIRKWNLRARRHVGEPFTQGVRGSGVRGGTTEALKLCIRTAHLKV